MQSYLEVNFKNVMHAKKIINDNKHNRHSIFTLT